MSPFACLVNFPSKEDRVIAVNESKIVLQPMQWGSLKDIDDVQKIGDSDKDCLEEIRQILEKHNMLDRFGVSLLHNHFDLADDEIMLETTDVSKREHWVRPVKKSELQDRNMEPTTTILRFDNQGWNQHCSCARSVSGHTGGHFG
jgi:hypothetical protein